MVVDKVKIVRARVVLTRVSPHETWARHMKELLEVHEKVRRAVQKSVLNCGRLVDDRERAIQKPKPL